MAACTAPEAARELEEQSTTPSLGGPSLSVLTFNTWSVPFRNDHLELRERTAAELAKVRADLVALQEVWSEGDARTYGEALREAGLVHQAHMASERPLARASSGLLVASRFPIARSRFVPFIAGATPWWPWPPDWYATKGLLDVELDTPLGRIRAIDTHLHAAYERDGSEAERLGQTLELAAYVRAMGDELPTILLGDLNSEPGELPHRVLGGLLSPKTVARSFVDHVAVLGGRQGTLDATHVSRAMVHPIRLASGRHTPMSDHAGLLVRLELRDAPRVVAPALEIGVRAEALSLLERVAGRAELHEWGGKICAVLFALGALTTVRRRLGARRVALLLVLASAAVWSTYHGWLLGPAQRQAAAYGLAVIENAREGHALAHGTRVNEP